LKINDEIVDRKKRFANSTEKLENKVYVSCR
jgi:hypothetical protein